jgi:hypothetical protein
MVTRRSPGICRLICWVGTRRGLIASNDVRVRARSRVHGEGARELHGEEARP